MDPDAAASAYDIDTTPCAFCGHPDHEHRVRHTILRRVTDIHPHAALRVLIDDVKLRFLFVCPDCQWMLFGYDDPVPMEAMEAARATIGWMRQVCNHFKIMHPDQMVFDVMLFEANT